MHDGCTASPFQRDTTEATDDRHRHAGRLPPREQLSSAPDRRPLIRRPLRSLARRRPLIVTPATTLRETLYRISQDQEDAAVIADDAAACRSG